MKQQNVRIFKVMSSYVKCEENKRGKTKKTYLF